MQPKERLVQSGMAPSVDDAVCEPDAISGFQAVTMGHKALSAVGIYGHVVICLRPDGDAVLTHRDVNIRRQGNETRTPDSAKFLAAFTQQLLNTLFTMGHEGLRDEDGDWKNYYALPHGEVNYDLSGS